MTVALPAVKEALFPVVESLEGQLDRPRYLKFVEAHTAALDGVRCMKVMSPGDVAVYVVGSAVVGEVAGSLAGGFVGLVAERCGIAGGKAPLCGCLIGGGFGLVAGLTYGMLRTADSRIVAGFASAPLLWLF